MIRPAGESSDDDEFKDYLSDDEDARFTNKALEHRKPIETNVKDNLFTAILNGKLDAVIAALDDGFHVNSKLKDNWTPLLLAASVGNPDVTKELIRRGADVNGSKDLYTPLMAACSCPSYTSTYERSLDVVRQLVENGADVNIKTRKRMTALMYASSNGNVAIVEMLLPICDVHAEDNQGWTALFWAVNDNKPDVLRPLLEAGLQVDKFDVRSNTPFYYARMNDFDEIMKLLPCKENKKKSSGILFKNYDIDDLFANGERPKFMHDISVMLYGMKSDQHAELLLNNDIDLLSFLCLTDADLLNMGIQAPYQRYRILNGLYRFHKRMYKVKSVPIVPRDAPYSTYDVLASITVACRQLIAMEASLKYLLQSIGSVDELKDFVKEVCQIKVKLGKIRKTVLAVSMKAKQWDLLSQPADIITSNSYKKPPRIITLKKCVTLGLFSTFAFVVVKKLCFSS